MRIVKVRLGKRSYDIVIGIGALTQLGKYVRKLNLGESAYIITNPLVKKACFKRLAKELNKSGLDFKVKVIPDTEKSKSIATLSSVIKDLAKFDHKKRTFIIAFGGGVVGDLSGLVASMYKRGIPYIQIPTTLLAQVDSAIGGKTAVDLEEGKNLIGAFYQPRLVLSDVDLLKTLPLRQLRTGLAEVIKYGIIKDPLLFAYLEKNSKALLGFKRRALEYVVHASSKIKADIVSRDEKEEKGLRTILNFGHTIGHAVEAASGFDKYTHGEAVGLGILAALDISKRLGFINNNLKERVEGLVDNIGLPSRISGLTEEAILRVVYRDKKFSGSKNRLVLVSRIGRVKVVKEVPLEVIEAALMGRIR